jgi:hypothetical protein
VGEIRKHDQWAPAGAGEAEKRDSSW